MSIKAIVKLAKDCNIKLPDWEPVRADWHYQPPMSRLDDPLGQRGFQAFKLYDDPVVSYGNGKNTTNMFGFWLPVTDRPLIHPPTGTQLADGRVFPLGHYNLQGQVEGESNSTEAESKETQSPS